MNGVPRYAIYGAPAPESALWAFGSRVLGYDAATGEDVHGFAPPGMSDVAWRRITERPRSYGFHATLKAPFRMNGYGEDDLRRALDAFSRDRPQVDCGRLGVVAFPTGGDGAGFVAMTPEAVPTALAGLERDIVVGFDRFRRPMTPEERALRHPQNLTERQRTNLDAYGYPYVLDEFKFHLTLSGETLGAAAIAAALADEAERCLGAVRLVLADVCLFRQDRPDCRFRIVSRHRLAA